ncbi:alpha-1,2-fucosyltransferase [Calditerrivibrio nitroreducens]|uniref:Glycosyl transferase family 11 n=1 Tax=Calditerrivibrio nitroreducens (strain DSM 19672 / NBRC 101217 / Yu37-1) TaxID=768670 RepID=E4TIL0_CALNY|nr:alpha-1,2-fucosyltransferase [Calditerrivibrio nitroreducens]ADR19058.1 glycosyl transferase family 11 [Calditerrivibrio nitroreducens DSM 19672]
MLVVRLAGGLGNQIFQLGASILLAYNKKIDSVYIDTSNIKCYETKREYELYKFFDYTRFPIKIIEKTFFLNKLRLPIHFPFQIPYYPFIGDKNFQFALNRASSKFFFLDGYFQESITQENFLDEINLLNQMFIPKFKEVFNECVVHIRGGDFIKLGWNVASSYDYYLKAIKIIITNYGITKFNVITDDRDYATSLLKDINCDYKFIGGDMYDDFYLIGSFKYRILSSSTFAIWASALGNNESSVVIAPELWRPYVKRKIFLPNELRIHK